MTSKEIIEKLQPRFPKIGYPTMTMVNHSNDYGVVLCNEALDILGIPYETKTVVKYVKSKKKSAPKKRATVTLSESENDELNKRLKDLGLSKQDYLKKLIQEDLSNDHNINT